MIKKLTSMILAALIFASCIVYVKADSSPVRINEVCSSNTGYNGNGVTVPDSSGDYCDYIELYNTSDKEIDLSGWGISDKASNPYKCVLPAGTVIEAGGYLLIYCSKTATAAPAVTLGISADGETLYLTSENGVYSHTVKVPALDADTTYAAATDGGDVFYIYNPSPNASNSTVKRLVAAPEFSVASGFYDENVSVELTSPEGFDIYYTLDGSDPAESDSAYLYSTALTARDRTAKSNNLSSISPSEFSVYNSTAAPSDSNVAKPTVIRAACKSDDGIYSKTVTNTYFIGVRFSYYNAAVLSITVAEDDLFDYDTGIYTKGKYYDVWKTENPGTADYWGTTGNYSQRGKEWEKDCHIEFFETDKTLAFSQDCGIRIQGGTSRTNIQKSFRFFARDEYGNNRFEYPIFNDTDTDANKPDEYKTFVVRNGGNDVSYSKYSDALLQDLVSDLSMTTQTTRPCVLFLNGEFWGMYVMQQDYKEQLIEDKYDIENDNVLLTKNGNPETGDAADKELYRDLYRYILNNDMSVPNNYTTACTMLDMDSFVDYIAVQMYISNADCYWGNWSMWRAREVEDDEYGDGRWRMLMFDTEYSSWLYGNDNTSYKLNNINTYCVTGDGSRHVQMMAALMKNSDFRKKFITRLLGIAAVCYDEQVIKDICSDYSDSYSTLLRLTEKRFNVGGKWAEDDRINKLKTFFKSRLPYVLQYLDKAFSLGETGTLTVNANDPQLGYISVDGVKQEFSALSNDDMNSKFFKCYPVTLTADAKEGYEFVGWSGDVISTDDTISVAVGDDTNITANFKRIEVPATQPTTQPTTQSTTQPTTQPSVIYGDCNRDGNINGKDVLLLRKYIVNLENDIDTVAADVMHDGKLNGKDVLKLRKYIVGIVKTLD